MPQQQARFKTSAQASLAMSTALRKTSVLRYSVFADTTSGKGFTEISSAIREGVATFLQGRFRELCQAGTGLTIAQRHAAMAIIGELEKEAQERMGLVGLEVQVHRPVKYWHDQEKTVRLARYPVEVTLPSAAVELLALDTLARAHSFLFPLPVNKEEREKEGRSLEPQWALAESDDLGQFAPRAAPRDGEGQGAALPQGEVYLVAFMHKVPSCPAAALTDLTPVEGGGPVPQMLWAASVVWEKGTRVLKNVALTPHAQALFPGQGAEALRARVEGTAVPTGFPDATKLVAAMVGSKQFVADPRAGRKGGFSIVVEHGPGDEEDVWLDCVRPLHRVTPPPPPARRAWGGLSGPWPGLTREPAHGHAPAVAAQRKEGGQEQRPAPTAAAAAAAVAPPPAAAAAAPAGVGTGGPVAAVPVHPPAPPPAADQLATGGGALGATGAGVGALLVPTGGRASAVTPASPGKPSLKVQGKALKATGDRGSQGDNRRNKLQRVGSGLHLSPSGGASPRSPAHSPPPTGGGGDSDSMDEGGGGPEAGGGDDSGGGGDAEMHT